MEPNDGREAFAGGRTIEVKTATFALILAKTSIVDTIQEIFFSLIGFFGDEEPNACENE